MKKILIGLLLVAVAASAFYFFYFRKPQNTVAVSQTPGEMIAGKWKIDSIDPIRMKDSSVNVLAVLLATRDSNLHNYEFEFAKEGNLIQKLNEKPVDTNHYRLADSINLVTWRGADTTHWNITQLDSASLVFQSKDSIVYRLKKVK